MKTGGKSSLRSRRSPCPVACTLDLVGDRWTLLVVRDLFLGVERFNDFLAGPETIPTNVLADRLERLLSARAITVGPASDGSKHRAYRLTPKGRDFGRILRALRDWGMAWEKGTRAVSAAPRVLRPLRKRAVTARPKSRAR